MALLAVSSYSILLGCRGGTEAVDGPQTVPVAGKVVVTKGPPVAELADRNVAVAFQSVEEPAMHAVGVITEDGSFHMATRIDDVVKDGVVAGRHRVCLRVDETSAPFVPPKLQSFATSGIVVTVPSEQEIIINISR